VVDYVRKWSSRSEVPQKQILQWLGIWSSTFCKWGRCYGQAYEHNAWIPRDHWLEDWEKQAIIKFHFEHPLNGYRRLTFMMMDANVVSASPGTVYRVLRSAGLTKRHNTKPSTKGQGFNQPLSPHQHWHLDIAYLNIRGTFYYIASLLDGFSRSVVHWEIREQMREGDVETIIQRARERYPNATPRVITDNGPQFVAKDFKEFIRISGMTHVRTSPYYPQSNGKIERFHRTLKSDCIRPKTPLNMEDAKRIVHQFVDEYNQVRLHSAIGYITPHDMLAGRQKEIHAARDAKLEEARLRRAQARKSQPSATVSSKATPRGDGSQATDYIASNRIDDGAPVGHNTRNTPMLLATGNDPPAAAAIPAPTTCQ
jgi:putative transposase